MTPPDKTIEAVVAAGRTLTGEQLNILANLHGIRSYTMDGAMNVNRVGWRFGVDGLRKLAEDVLTIALPPHPAPALTAGEREALERIESWACGFITDRAQDARTLVALVRRLAPGVTG